MKLAILGFIVLATSALVFCFAPLVRASYIEIVEYEEIETYYETESYEVESTEPLSYEVIDSYIRQVEGTETFIITIGTDESKQTMVGYLDIACVKIRNTDTVEGIFWVSISVDEPTFGWTNPDTEGNLDMFPEGKLSLAPGEIGIRQCAADELGDWSYSVSPSTKTVTVTEYREVEKQRTVTKQRPETCYKKVTLLDYLLHY